ncbi:hypothetical protein [Streptomyces sp. NPDC050534]|uniref:hypothetical protein n=1 Tax=Streptomyces sp. NPDC050534 TaxID=3365625 RepID=UPI00378EA956
MTAPTPPRLRVTAWTFTVLRRCYPGEKPWDVLQRAVRMLADADGHLTTDGHIKTGRPTRRQP